MDANLRQQADRHLAAFAVAFIGEARRYPPQPAPRSGRAPYRRTGNLARQWAVRRQQPGLIEITNVADYAEYVQGEQQAWMHRGVWMTVRDISDRVWPRFRDQIVRLFR